MKPPSVQVAPDEIAPDEIAPDGVAADEAGPDEMTPDGIAADEVAADEVVTLQRRYQAALLRVAAGYVGSRDVAEDVVQDTWLGAIRGLDRFEKRSSLKTWVFHILENIAKTRALREARTLPFSSIAGQSADGDAADEGGAGGWYFEDRHWPWGRQSDETPEGRLLFAELSRMTGHAIRALPPRERAVLTLRAIGGYTPTEVCDLLQISDANQRAALHRARSKMRDCLFPYLAEY